MISIEKLKKVYRNQTVVDVEKLFIPIGESFGLVGNNGAGKTTLFRMIVDLIRPTQGSIQLNGKEVQGNDEWKNYVGSFLDENFLITYLTPEEYFQFIGKLHNYSKEDLNAFYAKFESLFHGEILDKKKYISDLSKGNQKKVGIAATFIGNPQIIILDEPFENLDPTSQIRLKELLKTEKHMRNLTYLISSHDLSHVTEICERIVILEKGLVIKDMRTTENALSELEEYFKGSV